MRKFWLAYTNKVNLNCTGAGNEKDVNYWRNNLFAGSIIYLIPFCLIALVPGVYFSFLTGKYTLGAIDIFSAISMMLIAFLPGISIRLRKIYFISILTLLSCTLLIFLGLSGPGLLYLLATCIFSLLIFPDSKRYWPAWAVVLICLFFTLNLLLNIIPSPSPVADSVGEWIAMSSNLVFLSFLLTALIPKLFIGIENTLSKEKQLTEAYSKQQIALQAAIKKIELKNKELEQFAYIASHDLNEPLRMVTSFMGLLKKKYGDKLDVKAHTYIDFAVDGGKRMQTMISDLLELSRTGRADAVRELVPVESILDEVKQNIFKLLEESKTTIIVDSEIPKIPVYRGDISRLFQNLFSNAIKFKQTDINAEIRVSCSETDTMWQFCVADNGIGMDQTESEKIFDIFSRLHAQDIYQGSGIGLAVCKKVVEQHGGIIWVHSEENKGSKFYFTISKISS